MSMDMHRNFMLEAVAMARESVASGRGGPFGCVIVRDGRILAKAGNESKSQRSVIAHAEILAIAKALQAADGESLAGCTLYATGQPCPMCLAAIHNAGIKELYYSTTYAQAAVLGYRPTPFVDAVCGAYGASGAKADAFLSTPLLTVARLPMKEADTLFS